MFDSLWPDLPEDFWRCYGYLLDKATEAPTVEARLAAADRLDDIIMEEEWWLDYPGMEELWYSLGDICRELEPRRRHPSFVSNASLCTPSTVPAMARSCVVAHSRRFFWGSWRPGIDNVLLSSWWSGADHVRFGSWWSSADHVHFVPGLSLISGSRFTSVIVISGSVSGASSVIVVCGSGSGASSVVVVSGSGPVPLLGIKSAVLIQQLLQSLTCLSNWLPEHPGDFFISGLNWRRLVWTFI
ncbi:uncharacterized protein LOC114847788 isoform X2 [Betta splendens]|uniref:Uncharacterized protein LOC114847788 isoform X2 n=1 Tax=Betta splendens TaxID=158456 RepID=A0A9W2XGR2_BETSP|nr:uncharacterized protein LOC114847788 isoform X2 [Betta splendens]